MKRVELKNGIVATIREARKEDAKDLIYYVNSIAGESDYLTFSPGEFNISVDKEEEIIQSHKEKRNMIYLIAEIDGNIVAGLNFSGGKRRRTQHTGEFGVSVSKKYWGLGIGKELIKYLIDWAKDTEIIRKINLRVRSDNERAIKLYKSLGFKEEGALTRDFLIDGRFYDSIQMGLDID